MKENLTILWLDDQRNPLTYFKKKDEKGEGTFHDNLIYYQNLSRKYNLSFVWVKNYAEFVNYIKKNGVPEFVSFDHDLSKTSLPTEPKGFDCAKWLVNYCRENNVPMPETYVHSANPKWKDVIRDVLCGKLSEGRKNIIITESQFNEILKHNIFESVYINGIRGKKANLTYNKGSNWSRGNLATADNLRTNKMDVLGRDTYEVPLKGGITSYNITSINGTAVMHYFKKYFDHEKSEISLKDNRGVAKTYELEMMQNEFRQFMNQFVAKVGSVVDYVIGKSDEEIRAISIYPVPSSSNFNEKMAEELSKMSVNGLPVQVISQDLFVKDLRNVERDQEFIDKNKEYYNSLLANKGTMAQPIINRVDNNIKKYKALLPAEKNIDAMNEAVKKILSQVAKIKQAEKKGERDFSRMISSLVENYKTYYNNYAQALNIVSKISKRPRIEDVAEILKYSKGPSIEGRTDYVWNIVRSHIMHGVKMEVSPVTGKKYERLPLQYWKKTMFQIKNLSNPERMGLRNIYNPNIDDEFVQKELEKINGTAFVIFDDNISGGATLSDICYQSKQKGIKNIIPITFGKMAEKWQFGQIPINKPENGFNL